ncbi:MAG: carbon-nitrogen hydrolase family protein [Deltaproteobacteria bacterium]|nr:carbon-nitrogen hydrolase family protein [Deltaproteobacteria bacterium]
MFLSHVDPRKPSRDLKTFPLAAAILAVLLIFAGTTFAATWEIQLVERVCSKNPKGVTIAFANIHNRVSRTRSGIEQGASIEENKARILELVDTAKKAGANMVLFPEFSLTGYFWPDPEWNKKTTPYNPEGYAPCWAYMNKGALDHHKKWLKQLKSKLDKQLRYIIFNALRKNPSNPNDPAGPGNKFLNSTYVLDKDFNCEDLVQNEANRIYDKTMLPGIENIYEKSGQNDVLVVDTPWGRFGFTTCYDMCFSQLYESYRDDNHVDGVIELASWRGPALRAYPMMNIRNDEYYGYQWNLMAAARAATNQMWIVACNSVKIQHVGKYNFWGSSGLWAPSGIPLFQASNVNEELWIIHGVNILQEVKKEDDAFDFYDSFIKVYHPIMHERAFTRME